MLKPADTIPPAPLNRVPQITVDFWLIKLMAVTVGETAADYLAVNLGLGLTATSLIMTAILVVALVLQFTQKRYVPWAYWIAVVLISIVGTLITDNLVDNFGVRLETTTIWFSVALVVTFVVWYAYERTLSIHTIFTIRREVFYWLAILFTFSLGTAAGDLVAETFDMGYLTTGLMFGAAIAVIALAYYVLKLDGILAFWLAYILTRPLGASFGDLLSQPVEYGGLGFGTIVTSLIFLGTIAAIILYMTITQDGEDALADAIAENEAHRSGVHARRRPTQPVSGSGDARHRRLPAARNPWINRQIPNMRSQTSGYSLLQITLHWSIAVLILFQLLFGESMTAFVDAVAEGRQLPQADQTMGSAHYWVGIAILALVVVRIGVRLVAGAPTGEPSAPRWMMWASRATHAVFYALLVAVPVSGLLAYYVWDWMGNIHAIAKPAFIVLIGIHAAAALAHHFVLKDAVLRKMLVPAADIAE